VIVVHEGTLLEYLAVLQTWCDKIGDEVSPNFLKYISTGLSSLKGQVRTSFCGLLVRVFENKRIHQLPSLSETLLKFVEKLTGQLSQVILQ